MTDLRLVPNYDARAEGALCDSCPYQHENTLVPPAPSKKKVRLVLVGEAPGRMEVVHSKPFVGPSGQLLDEVLEEAEIDRREAWVTNAILCRGPEENQPRAAACCAGRLAKELEAIPADVPIVTLGKVPVRSVLGATTVIKRRGFVWRSKEVKETSVRSLERSLAKGLERGLSEEKIATREHALWHKRALQRIGGGRVIMPTLHPAFVLRADFYRPVLAVDIERVGRWLKSEGGLPLADQGGYEVVSWRKLRKALKKLGSHVSVDIESNTANPLECHIKCIGFSDDEHAIVAFPYTRRMDKVITEAFKKRTAIFHNGPPFDMIAMGVRGIRFPKWEDTLLAVHAYAGHLPKGLNFVGSFYCDTGPWKMEHSGVAGGEEKGLTPDKLEDEELCHYNAADVRIDCQGWHRMQADLEPERKVYEHDKLVAMVCQDMIVNGLRIDRARQRQLKKELEAQRADLLGKMRSISGRADFTPRKYDLIRDVLFGKFGMPVIGLTEKGAIKSDAKVLEELRLFDSPGGQLAGAILDYRSIDKAISTFLSVTPGSDGRIHPPWKNFGTETGRPACGKPNVLNIPRKVKNKDGSILLESRIREIYIPDRDKVYVYFDLSQAEMRLAAYLSRDPAFMAACESDDLHTTNALILFPDAEQFVVLEDGKKTLGGPGKTFRNIAKQAGFGINYLAGVDKVLGVIKSQGINCSRAMVEGMLDMLHYKFRHHFKYIDTNIEYVRQNGHLRSPVMKRIRWMGWNPDPPMVANFPVQAGIADLMNLCLIELRAKKPLTCKQVMYAYDAAIFECPRKDADTMMGLCTEYWGKPILLDNGSEFIMPIDKKVGERMSDVS